MSITIGSKCQQCGMIHPPLPQGERCPNATTKDEKGTVIDFTPLLSPLKNIVTSQIQLKKITNIKKFFGFVIVEMTKIIENYKD